MHLKMSEFSDEKYDLTDSPRAQKYYKLIYSFNEQTTK